MGTQTSTTNTPLSAALFNPDLKDWKIVGEGENYFIWRNSHSH